MSSVEAEEEDRNKQISIRATNAHGRIRATPKLFTPKSTVLCQVSIYGFFMRGFGRIYEKDFYKRLISY